MNEDKEIIKINPALLNALSKGGLNLDVFGREIVALECFIAGTSFRNLNKVENELDHKVKLEMKRESDNKFDKCAIALWYDKTKVGYIPKDKNEVLSRLMDAGKQFYSTIEAKEYEGNWLKLFIQVIMKD
ncbi:MAG TPA: HIRAN domain-containing protein [Segetibacter sp.]|jgi:hypothetical protein